MKHHYYPTKEKKLAAIIHTTIRTPNSIKIIDDKAPDRDEKLSSVSFFKIIYSLFIYLSS